MSSADQTGTWPRMIDDLVRIVYPGGALIVPFDEPDNGRLLAELLERYGEVELGLGVLQARVQPVPTHSGGTCTLCGERLRRMMCVQQSRHVCLRCFKAGPNGRAAPASRNLHSEATEL